MGWFEIYGSVFDGKGHYKQSSQSTTTPDDHSWSSFQAFVLHISCSTYTKTWSGKKNFAAIHSLHAFLVAVICSGPGDFSENGERHAGMRGMSDNFLQTDIWLSAWRAEGMVYSVHGASIGWQGNQRHSENHVGERLNARISRFHFQSLHQTKIGLTTNGIALSKNIYKKSLGDFNSWHFP